jgi:lysophospholipase L1-like esterase
MMNKISIWLVWSLSICGACDGSSGDAPSTKENSTDSETGEENDTGPVRVSTKEMLERSLVSLGNNVRVKAVLDKAADGEEVTLAYIGGSITEGYTTTADDSYVVGSYEMFKARFATGDGDNIHYVNAGMGGTPSSLGMIRYERDVVEPAPSPPDLVFVEFAVNDNDDVTNGAAYESLVRKILLSENKPAVVLIFCVFRSHWNLQDRLQPVGEHYDLPMISIKDAVVPELEEGTLTEDDFFRDDYHPNSFGFQIMSETIDYFFEKVAEAETDEEDIQISEDTVIGGQFTEIVGLFQPSDPPPSGVEIEVGSFTEVDNATRMYEYSLSQKTFPTSWHKTSKESNDPFRLTVTCRNLALVYKMSTLSTFGTAEAILDGDVVETLDSQDAEAWNNPVTTILLDEEEAAPHTLEIRMVDDDADKKFTILALGYTP